MADYTSKDLVDTVLAEVVLSASDGHSYKLSTEARVTPDNIK